MTLQWGEYHGHLRLGIDVTTDPYDTYTPHIDVRAAIYVQCSPSFNFSDNQTVTVSGSRTATFSFFNGLQAGQVLHVGTVTIADQGQNYNGGPTYRFRADLSGAFNGASPTQEVYFTLPPRPKRLPAPPSPGPQPITVSATSVSLTWGRSPDYGGGTPNADRLQISTVSGFSSLVHDSTAVGNSRSVGGLAPGVTYWARAAVRTEVGWSGWSATTQFRTSSLAMSTPAVSQVGPDSATVSWVAPSSGTAEGYELQLSTDPGFTSGLASYRGTSTSRILSALAPGTAYWVRVRATTSSGSGPWSSAASFQTLSGARVRVNGAWVDGVAYARVNGAWVIAKVHKRVNGAWVL